MTTKPVKNVCQCACRPTEERPFFKVDMIRTPMSVPTMEPEPPDMDVPPMTTAAMALSSSPLPLPGVMVV